MQKTINDWWRGAVIYQIYPRSFLDTNNDGSGDLNGIYEKLEYVASLNVDAIWISPFFKSPMKDHGYDISGYREIDPIFGSMQDFENIVKKAHSLNLKIIIDLVLSHTSNEHPWFKDPNKKDWYVWADPKENGIPPNNWVSLFGGCAWEWDERYKQYYLHNFLKEQPDLNVHNPEVQEELLDICRFWLDKNVDGFRLDVVNFYFHDKELRDNPPRDPSLGYATQFEQKTPYSSQYHIYDKSRPETFDFLARLRALTDEYDNRVLIGEIGDDHPYKLARQYTCGNKYLHTSYNPHMMSGTEKSLTQSLIREPIEEFYNNAPPEENGWPSWAFSNHDVVRAASRWYRLYDHNPRLSKLLIALLGCLPGSIFLYQGEELGLPETKIPYDLLQDPWAKETWPDWQGRDGCRTPMPWTNTRECEISHKCSTENKPWLPIAENHLQLNVKDQERQKDSPLIFTQQFLKWRKTRDELIKGKFKFIDTNTSKIIHLIRLNSTNETNCIFNLSDKNIEYEDYKMNAYSFHIDGLPKI